MDDAKTAASWRDVTGDRRRDEPVHDGARHEELGHARGDDGAGRPGRLRQPRRRRRSSTARRRSSTSAGKSLQDLRATQHLQGNYAVEVNGDTAQASCYLQANHFQEGLPGGDTFVVWAKYRDDFVRTADGWRIKKRYLDTISAGGNMNLFAEAAEAAGRTANA